MDSKSLFDSGNLEDAVRVQLDVVKKRPADLSERVFLVELCCFQGDWERADRQLDAALNQSADPLPLVSLVRNLVRGEIRREQFFTEGRSPDVLKPLDEHGNAQLGLCVKLRGGEHDLSADIEASNKKCKAMKWFCDEEECLGLLDLDDRFQGMAELLTATGKYYWIAWNAIRSLKFETPKRPRDLIWRRAEIATHEGLSGVVYIPARYPEPQSWSEPHQLARQTDWESLASNVTVGVGQRLLLLGEKDRGILEFTSLSQAHQL